MTDLQSASSDTSVPHIRRSVTFKSGQQILAGDMVLPADSGPHPALLFVAGTGAQNRYGEMVLPDGEVLSRERGRWFSHHLAQHGIASFTWDKRGVGHSTGGDRLPGDPPGDRDSHANVTTDVDDALSALEFLSAQPEIDDRNIVVMGHSAGVYFSCLLAARTSLPMAYILFGGVYMDIESLMAVIYEQVIRFANLGAEQLAFAQKRFPAYHRTAQRWREILAAAWRGDDVYEGEVDGHPVVQHLERLKEEIAFPLPDQFKFIQCPVLVIHGDQDMNVPLRDAYNIHRALQDAGNDQAALIIVPGGDHGMRLSKPEWGFDQRFRFKFEHDPDDRYSELFVYSIIGWIRDRLH